MKHATTLVVALITALAAGGGYWAGRQGADEPAAAPGDGQRKVLYYRNPMGLPDRSPVPKKDQMGMDYIPVYEGEAEAPAGGEGTVAVNAEKVQKLGVRTEAAKLVSLARTLRAVGRVEADERRSYAVTAKFEGYVERLLVNTTGQPVGRGQALFEVYSPELVSAQREYAIAAQGVEAMKGAGSEAQAGMHQLAEASLARLRNWDIPEAQLQALAKTGEIRRTLTFRSPVAGVVTERKIVQGMRIMPGEPLYQIADLSAVWVVADLPEQDIASVRAGAPARVRIDAYPGKLLSGRIAYVYPGLQADTRTVPVRIELANPDGLLKPGMFAQVELETGGGKPVVAVPQSAVIDSGTRQIVLVEAGEGRFEPRAVQLGRRGDDAVEVIDGVREGERVVVAANFLIDAESNLRAAVGSFGQPAGAGKPATQAVGHRAEGRVDEVDAKAGTAMITHQPVPSLKWPAMTMEFRLANDSLAKELRPGAAISFEFVERAPGEWVITSLKPAAPSGRHAGH